jgi:glycosyltransferase involved in cell wall biosynthesis
VIVSNHLWLDDFARRSARPEKCSVFINNVDSGIFYPRPRTRTDGRRIIMFHGSFSRHQGVDLVVQALPAILRDVPAAEFHLYGGGAEERNLVALARELGVEHAVKFNGGVALDEIPQIIANADVGVVAKRADSFGNRAYSTKILEFMSQSVPVVLSKTEIDSYYFDDSTVRFFESGNVAELANALIDVLTDHSLRDRLVQQALVYAARNSWESRKHEYHHLVDSLIETGRAQGFSTAAAAPAVT